MKITFKNLEGHLDYLPQLQIYVAEFIIEERVFSFSGENKLELYKHISEQLEPYVAQTYFDVNLVGIKGKEMTFAG
jgi:hypothetical protein